MRAGNGLIRCSICHDILPIYWGLCILNDDRKSSNTKYICGIGIDTHFWIIQNEDSSVYNMMNISSAFGNGQQCHYIQLLSCAYIAVVIIQSENRSRPNSKWGKKNLLFCALCQYHWRFLCHPFLSIHFRYSFIDFKL